MLKRLVLENFRNYEREEFELNEGITGLVGRNAVGKTNILEAVRLLSVGESFRAKRIEEMVRFGEEMGRVEGWVGDDDEKLTVVLTRGEVVGKRVAKRRFLIDDLGKKKSDFVGILPTVVFRPEDLELVDGSPGVRRKWMDTILVQTEREYQRSLMAYEKALRRRNRVLEAIRDGVATRYQLTFWDGLVIKNGQVLSEMREGLINYVNELFKRSDLFSSLRIDYDKSVISEKRLEQYKNEEVMAGHTLVGPHKDDLIIKKDDGGVEKNRDLSIYGSRGEQRMAVLGLKMGELLYMEDRLGKKPLLLLDDVFSELDEKHGDEVQRVMLNRQVIVTTTNKDDLEGIEKLKVIKLS